MEIKAQIIDLGAEVKDQFDEMLAQKKFEEECKCYQHVIMATALANAENPSALIDKAAELILGCNKNYQEHERLSADDIEIFKTVVEDVKAKIALNGVADGDYSKAGKSMESAES